MKQGESSYSGLGRGYEQYYTNFTRYYRITTTVFLSFCEQILFLFSMAGRAALVILRQISVRINKLHLNIIKMLEGILC